MAPQAKVDLNALAREVVLQYLPLAREKHQDLGWVDYVDGLDRQADSQAWVLGSDVEIHESIANLVHNAINHAGDGCRSEEHTSELQSLMRISYAVFCLKKKKKNHKTHA